VQPNPEQEQAIATLMRLRFAMVCGKAGTGKTFIMKAVFSAYMRGMAIGVSFTGMAADNQRRVAGHGITAHKIVSEWRNAGSDITGTIPYAFSGRTVLVIDEASAMSMKLLYATLLALGPSLRRIYFFGDYRQLPSPDGGPSVMEALLRRYKGTPIVSDLKQSMRVTEPTGFLVHDLDRICEYRVDDDFKWSPDPSSGHPFVFLERGKNARENVDIIRKALTAAGIDPDSTRSQIMVHTNETRIEISKVKKRNSSTQKNEHPDRLGMD
jgi:hypothetical protein